MSERYEPGGDDKLLSGKRAAELLGISTRTLYRYEGRGYIEATKTPVGVRRYRPEDIERLRVHGIPRTDRATREQVQAGGAA